MLTVDNLQLFFRPLSADEVDRARYMIPIVYDTIKQEGINRGVDIDATIASGDLLQPVIDSEVAGIVTAFLAQPTDISLSDASDGYAVVYAPTVRVVDRVLARLGIRSQVLLPPADIEA